MTDWEKLKVTELKEELKSRGIALTGLKLKQQLVDKLNEIDVGSENADSSTELASEHDNLETSVNESTEKEAVGKRVGRSRDAIDHDASESTRVTNDSDARSPQHVTSEVSTAKVENSEISAPARKESPSTSDAQRHLGEKSSSSTREDKLPDDLPAELKKEESIARDGATPPAVEAETKRDQKAIESEDPFIPQNPPTTGDETNYIEGKDTTAENAAHFSGLPNDQDVENAAKVAPKADEHMSTVDPTSSTVAPTPEILDDQRKRKRRSHSPAPESQGSSNKRVKVNDEPSSGAENNSEALKMVEEATSAAQEIRSMDDPSTNAHIRTQGIAVAQNDTMDHEPTSNNQEGANTLVSTGRSREASKTTQSPSPERNVSPALHPATRSLYMRNFKRPLHIPSLRSHISSLAASSGEDALKVFYLDNVRTHALVSFNSISAASRVRNSMHDSRFPDEPMREPLWVDFVPDEKVQDWIDQETGSGGSNLGGGRGSSKKYEVFYNQGPEGVQAIHREASLASTQTQRPGVQQSRSNRMVPQDPTATASIASGIHPSRTSLAPRSPPAIRSRPRPQPSDPGKGFRALDELFSSTTTKPKLYYRLPMQTVIDDRLDMMRDLRVTHDQMGQSGDEGMKRYTFEKDARTGQEEWVDKGPEFGFGRRGQERLTGFGNSYGSGRGRGTLRGARRGGDSWRAR